MVSAQLDYASFSGKIDSGCSSHTFDHLNYFDDYKVIVEEGVGGQDEGAINRKRILRGIWSSLLYFK